jgi:hypothetical protein
MHTLTHIYDETPLNIKRSTPLYNFHSVETFTIIIRVLKAEIRVRLVAPNLMNIFVCINLLCKRKKDRHNVYSASLFINML